MEHYKWVFSSESWGMGKSGHLIHLTGILKQKYKFLHIYMFSITLQSVSTQGTCVIVMAFRSI